MEHNAGHVVVMPTARVNFPCFVLVHTPQFNLSIIGTGYDKRQRRVEASPVNAAVVTLEHVLYDSIGSAKQISGTL